MHRPLTILCSAAALFLQGCLPLTGKRPVDETEMGAPEAYRSASQGNQGKISTGWVATFRDKDLKNLVDEALAHNLDLKQAEANLQAARETRKAARSARLPAVRFSGGGTRIRRGDGFSTTSTDNNPTSDNSGTDNRSNGGGDAGLTSVDYAWTMAASWELDLWGRLRDLDRAGMQDYLAAQADFRGARLSLAADAARSWFDLITTRQQVTLAEKTLASYESNLRITERNYEAGDDTASALDVQFGRNNVASAERAVVRQRLVNDEAARTLEVLLGRYPAAQLESRDNLPAPAGEVPAGLPSELLWRRPDLVAAAADLRASASRANAARKNLLPSINLTGRASSSSEALGRMLTDPEFIIWNAAASLAQTIYEGGAPSADARRALAQNEAALRRFASLVLRAFREVESALATERSLAEQEKFLKVELQQANLAEDQASREYSDGIVGILEILEAQRRAVSARNSMIVLQNQRLQNRIDLHLALGGDFATPAPE